LVCTILSINRTFYPFLRGPLPKVARRQFSLFDGGKITGGLALKKQFRRRVNRKKEKFLRQKQQAVVISSRRQTRLLNGSRIAGDEVVAFLLNFRAIARKLVSFAAKIALKIAE